MLSACDMSQQVCKRMGLTLWHITLLLSFASQFPFVSAHTASSEGAKPSNMLMEIHAVETDMSPREERTSVFLFRQGLEPQATQSISQPHSSCWKPRLVPLTLGPAYDLWARYGSPRDMASTRPALLGQESPNLASLRLVDFNSHNSPASQVLNS